MKKLFLTEVFLLMVLVICSAGLVAQTGKPVLSGKKMEVLKKGKQIIFSDGAEVRDATTKITAEIIVHNQPDNSLEVKNNIHIHHILKSSATVDISGDTGFYRLNERTGSIFGEPGRINYQPVDYPLVKLQCRTINFNLNTQDVSGEQEVFLSQENSFIRADSFWGNFLEPNGFLNFVADKREKLEAFYDSDKYDLYFYCQELSFYPEQKQVKFQGQVVAKIIPK